MALPPRDARDDQRGHLVRLLQGPLQLHRAEQQIAQGRETNDLSVSMI